MAPSRTRRITATITLLGTVLAVSGCSQERRIGEAGAEPTTLVVSAAYTQGVGGGPERLAGLRQAIDDLRAATGSGWVGRQDDVTGYLAELSGGRYFAGAGADAPAVISSLMDTYGAGLFGVGSADLALGETAVPDVTGSSTVRATQQVGGVPVLDGVLLFTLGDAAGEPRLNSVRGRAFGGLDVTTTPTVPAARARTIAARVSGGTTRGRPELVVVPTGTGRLAWAVAVVAADASGGALAPTDGRYYVDATSGDLVTVRTATAEGRTPVLLPDRSTGLRSPHTARPALNPARRDEVPGSVEVTGNGPGGVPLTAYGVRTQRGVVLVDTTVSTFDSATGEGGIETYDAQGSDDTAALPGRLYTERAQNGTTITDPDALAAHSFSRAVYDYYTRLGRASWDGAGGSLVSSVHYGDETFCNSFFSGSLDPPQMVYGNTCAPGGDPAEATELDIDTAGHEITHGVTDTSAGLIYSGQSGALNESFSDYFGNVIGNLFNGIDTAAVMEDTCRGFTTPTFMCQSNPEGTTSVRYLLNGNTFDDYLNVLNPPLRLQELGLDNQDSGGVHLNSSIWNNALWSIRTRLAQMDGTSGNDSRLAGDFDKIVYAALTTQLGPTSGFVDAREAVEQTTVAAGADPVILRVARETFDANKICAGCTTTGDVPGVVVSASPQTELGPAVHGDRIAWLNQGDGALGSAASASVGGTPSSVGAAPDTAQVVFGGDAMVVLEYPGGQIPGDVLRYDESGTPTTLGRAGRSTLTAGLAGGDDGAAWVSEEAGTVSFVDAGGTVTESALPDLGGDSVTAVGTGDGLVGLGTGSGRVLAWTPGGDLTEIGRVPGAVLAAAAYGDRVLAVDDAGSATIFGVDGSVTTLSTDAIPYGGALNGDYAVWVNTVGELGGGVAESEGHTFPDGDLYLYSFGSGTIYDLMPERGQQGFPAISGDRLVWQDSVFGGDDILTATIPSGL